MADDELRRSVEDRIAAARAARSALPAELKVTPIRGDQLAIAAATVLAPYGHVAADLIEQQEFARLVNELYDASRGEPDTARLHAVAVECRDSLRAPTTDSINARYGRFALEAIALAAECGAGSGSVDRAFDHLREVAAAADADGADIRGHVNAFLAHRTCGAGDDARGAVAADAVRRTRSA